MNAKKQQRIAIAKACGWTNIRYSTSWEVTDPPDNPIVLCGVNHKVAGDYRTEIPDYPNDLNACHEMEKVLTDTQQQVFLYLLHGEKVTYDNWNLVHTTAAQRCEAFLRTIGKWEDKP